jgi:membrane protease YdiL (CAAX protease family)
MNATVSTSRAPWAYFVLVFAISTPFWVLGAVSSLRLTPNLSLGSLMIVAPFVTAVLLTTWDKGPVGASKLLKQVVDVHGLKGRAWYLPIFLLMPALMVVEVGVLRLAGVSIPDPTFTLVDVLVGIGVYFIAALLEEVGWSGYAIDRLQARWSPLTASVILGLVWGVWHLPAMLEMPTHHTPDWIAWQFTNLVLTRIVIVWIYNNTGRSVLAAVLYHAVMNVSTLVLFPIDGSYYDPFVADVLLAVVVAAIVLWGPLTLAEHRYGCTTQPSPSAADAARRQFPLEAPISRLGSGVSLLRRLRSRCPRSEPRG